MAFGLFTSLRVLAYLPTIWAVAARGDSGRYSLWTWLVFLSGNATMGGWLWEENWRRANRAVAGSAANTLMCVGGAAVIVW